MQKPPRHRNFFEKQWLSEEGFVNLIDSKWKTCKLRWPSQAYSLDKWHGGICYLQNFLKGWGSNIRGEYKKRKLNIINKIKGIDNLGEGGGVDMEALCQRAALELELENSWNQKKCIGSKEGARNGS